MKTIIVAVDFSPSTSQVIDAALGLADAVHGQLVISYVVSLPIVATDNGMGVEMMTDGLEAAEEAADLQLERLKKRLQEAKVACETVKLTGQASASILELAEERKADYIVIGSHGHSALYDLLVGSTAHAILTRASCPVMVVPSPARPAHG